MDWFLYDNGIRHERVKTVWFQKVKLLTFIKSYYLFYDYKHLPFSNKPYQPEMNFFENKYRAF